MDLGGGGGFCFPKSAKNTNSEPKFGTRIETAVPGSLRMVLADVFGEGYEGWLGRTGRRNR